MLNVTDAEFRGELVSRLMALSFFRRLRVTERCAETEKYFPGSPANLIITDSKPSGDIVTAKGPGGIPDSLIVRLDGPEEETEKTFAGTPVIRSAREFFMTNLEAITGFCYLTHMVRVSVAEFSETAMKPVSRPGIKLRRG